MTTESVKNQPIQQEQFATREAASASQPAIHFSEELQAKSIEPKQSAQFGGVGVYHVIYPPDEVEVTFTHHSLAVQGLGSLLAGYIPDYKNLMTSYAAK